MAVLEITGEERRAIADALNKTYFYLIGEADDARDDPKYSDLEEMYRGDAGDYEFILTLFMQGEYALASNAFWRMDTASRDHLFTFLSHDATLAAEKFLNL